MAHQQLLQSVTKLLNNARRLCYATKRTQGDWDRVKDSISKVERVLEGSSMSSNQAADSAMVSDDEAFFRLVVAMRSAQREYVQTHSQEARDLAIDLAKQVDQAIADRKAVNGGGN